MGAKEVWVPISSTNTRPEGSMLPTSVRHRLLKNSSLSAAPLDLFSAPAKGSYRPADRRFAHRNPRDGEQELGPLGVGGPRSPFEVFYEQLAGLLAQLRSLAWGLRRLQGAALVELLAVAFDRSAIDPEAAGGLGFGDALFHRFDYLLSKVQRVCSHVSTIPGATSTQPAVTDVNRRPVASRCSTLSFARLLLRTAREANSGERSLRPQVGVGVVGVGHEVRSAYIQLRRFLYKPDPRLGYSRIARCAIRDRKRSAATGPPDSIIHLHDTWITRFPSLCSALEESPG